MSKQFSFGTVGVPLSTPVKPGGSVGGIYKLAEMELAAFELGWVQSVRVTEETCRKIKSASQEKNVALSVHAPYFINLNASEDEWPKSRQRLMDAAYFGNLAGATDIIFHPGSYFNQPADEVLPIAISRLKGCLAEIRSAGNPVILRPETMGKSAMLGSLQDTLIMSHEVEGVLPCLDFAHLHARTGDGSMNSYEEWNGLLNDYAHYLGNNSLTNLHVHLSGIEYSSKGEKRHLPVQKSDLNVTDLFRALNDHHCSGRILCESPILEEDAVYLQNLWRSVTA